MSNREFAKSLIDQIPESKLYDIIAYLQGQQFRKKCQMPKLWKHLPN